MTVKPPLPSTPVVVAGLGRAGEAALSLLAAGSGPTAIKAWDVSTSRTMQARAARWRRRGVEVSLGGDGTDQLPAGSVLVKSPGIPMTAPIVQAASRLGVTVLDELEIGWRACRSPMVGVTGTNGKSTTCAVIASILGTAGLSTQVVGNTEFGPALSGAKPSDVVVCEVSSFQLEAAPTMLPDVGVFTNLTQEHLPRHLDMQAYGAIKQSMFVRNGQACRIAVANADDPWGRRILTAAAAAGARTISYGFAPDADLRLVDVRWTMRDACMTVQAGTRAIRLQSHLPGRHNALNATAAIAAALALDIPEEAIWTGLSVARPPPGRWQLIGEGQDFDVVVDYAHTPDGIAQTLAALRAVAAARGGALLTVFGAVGLPDPPKARSSAEALAAYSDRIILTTGSAPRSCRVLRLAELREAAGTASPVSVVLERRDAIRSAIGGARSGDVVAILGLGALRGMALDRRGTYVSYNDRDVVLELLRKSVQ